MRWWDGKVWTQAAGWYPDPSGNGQMRWWDGRAWTDSRSDQPPPPPGKASAAPVAPEQPARGVGGAQPARPASSAKPPWYRRPLPLIGAGMGAVIVIAAIASGGSEKSDDSAATSQSTTTTSTAPAISGATKDARAYIADHTSDFARVQAMVGVVQIAISKGSGASGLVDVAQNAQEAHDMLDQIRNNFLDTSLSGEGEDAAATIWSSVNELKNSMGALVAYTGNPNPATLAHFNTQYRPAASGWNSGVKVLWRVAHKKHPPTL